MLYLISTYTGRSADRLTADTYTATINTVLAFNSKNIYAISWRFYLKPFINATGQHSQMFYF